MSTRLQGDYKIAVVPNIHYQKWVTACYTLREVGYSFGMLQAKVFEWFKVYFYAAHPQDRLLAINNSDLPNSYGQAQFFYAHRPLTPEEQSVRGWATYCAVPEYDPQWIMVDEELYITPSLSSGKDAIIGYLGYKH